jgi:hypothetical protein
MVCNAERLYEKKGRLDSFFKRHGLFVQTNRTELAMFVAALVTIEQALHGWSHVLTSHKPSNWAVQTVMRLPTFSARTNTTNADMDMFRGSNDAYSTSFSRERMSFWMHTFLR